MVDDQPRIDWRHAARPSLSLYQEPWWLDAVAPGEWEAAEVWRGGRLVARWPYLVRHTASGHLESTMPALTQTLGPWMEITAEKPARRISQETALLGALVDEMPATDRFVQRLHFGLSNGLALHWRGFEQSLRYTYVLDDLNDPEQLWMGFLEQARRAIRKAQKVLRVEVHENTGAVYEQMRLTYARQGRPPPVSRELLERTYLASQDHAAGAPLVAVDANGRIHAGIFVVWDERSAYYVAGGADPEHRSSGAMSLLFWEILQRLSGQTRIFDFEGSMEPSIERFFRTFGAQQRSFMMLSRYSEEIRTLESLRAGLSGLARKPSLLGYPVQRLLRRLRNRN